ncbi:MAG: acylphosphatase [Dehalococcoidia bacterium]|nr:acylphosphatase [Dehalococcoidia bacterium]
MAELAQVRAIIQGRVQGVFYRYFVQDIANNLALKGYVCNLPGGNAVEVIAEGNQEQLEQLVKQLEIGPPSAKVKKIQTEWSGYSGQFNRFSIKY